MIAATIVCPVVLFGFSTIAAQMPTVLFSDRSLFNIIKLLVGCVVAQRNAPHLLLYISLTP
ncbi:hypothetical protein [Nostoc sp.]